MDFDIETFFVKKSIKSEYQERILFELTSKKHREKAVSRFAHSASIYLKNDFLNCDFSCFINQFVHNKKNKTCYIISNGLYDGESLPTQEAIEFCQKSYVTVILISSNFIAIKEEVERGSPMFFVLAI